MASIKFSDIKKYNEAAGNNFEFDVNGYVMHGDKTLELDINQENGNILEFTICYIAEFEGEGWSAKRTGRQIPKLRAYNLVKGFTESCYHVNFLYDEVIGEAKTKKMFNYLLKLSNSIDMEPYKARALEMINPTETEEAPEPVEVDENSAVIEGMKFEDASGDVYTITKLDSMQVEFNGGARSLYDFGTSRTVGAVLHGLGNGAHLISAPQDAQTVTETDETTTAEEEPETTPETATEDAQTAKTETSEEEPTTDTETATDTATEPQAEEPEEEKETARTDEEQPEEAPENDKPDYSALAAAYFTGKTIKTSHKKTKKEEEPKKDTTKEEKTATEDENKPQTPPKTAPGYTGEPSDILTEEEAERLTKGEQVRKESENYKRIFTAVQYTDRTALLYSIDRYQYRGEECDPLQPKNDFHYIGFITDNKTYINAETIQEEMRNDIAEELRQMIPDEATARANAEKCEDWEKQKIENAEKYGANDAKNLFYKDETPQLYLYSHMEKIKSVDLIRYIENPAQVVTEYATAYAESHAADIAADYIRYNLLTAAIKEIKDNPSDPAHLIKKIAHCIGETEKTARIELANGETVTAEARAIRGITHGGYISEWYIKAADRDKLRKDERGRAEDIQPEEIKAIYHGQRTLYRAA